MAETRRVQYVYLDIVGFTRNRYVEAQSDLVAVLNRIVDEAIVSVSVDKESTIFIPTGDGMAIALIDVAGIDVHLRLALAILRLVEEHNGDEPDPMRQFEVRIGVNENSDNLVVDINGRRNVAGAGISMAQRIMDKADGGQVLVGRTVYDVLRPREAYFSSFRKYSARVKHGTELDLYQYIAKDARGLNIGVPTAFASTSAPQRPALSKRTAYYMCHAILNRDWLVKQKGDPMRDYAAVVLLDFLADDSEKRANTLPTDEAETRTWSAGLATFEEQYAFYRGIDFWVIAEYQGLIVESRLSRYSDCFERADYQTKYAFVSAQGIARLHAECPEIAAEMGIPDWTDD